MEEILNSIDLIFLTKDQKVMLIRRDNEPENNKLALIGGLQEIGDSFNETIVKVIKKRLNVVCSIKNDEITISSLGRFEIKQIQTYDSGEGKWRGNSTVFLIETDLEEKEISSKIKREIIFYDKDKIPKLAFEHNKFLKDFFYFHKGYTVANIQEIGVTVDIVIFTVKDKLLKILLTKRSKEPFKGYYTLPGGFVDKSVSLNESALKILKRDTNITNAYLEQLYTFGDVKRDSRERVISIAYYALIDYSKLDLVMSSKYEEIDWFSLSDIDRKKIGFDHKDIIKNAIERLKNKIEYTNIAFQLLPEKFTLAELQEVYETILEKEVDKRNFRKKIAELDMLEELEEYKKEGRMRPARYHRFKERKKETILKAKKWV